jgi:hypothetical protein
MVFRHQVGNFVVYILAMSFDLVVFNHIAAAGGTHDAHHVTSRTAKQNPMAQARAISAIG